MQLQAEVIQLDPVQKAHRRSHRQQRNLFPSRSWRQTGEAKSRSRLALAFAGDQRREVVPVHAAALQRLTNRSRYRHPLTGLVAAQQQQKLG